MDRRPDKAAKNTPDTTDLVVDETNQKVVVKPRSGNTYTFNDDEKTQWAGHDTDSEFARAWSRLHRSGRVLGKPTSDIIDKETFFEMEFQFCLGRMQKEESNRNMMVLFFDGHGLVGQESGL